MIANCDQNITKLSFDCYIIKKIKVMIEFNDQLSQDY